VDTNAASLSKVHGRFRGVAVTTRLEDVLADPAVQAIVVATPTSTHYELIRQVLFADKHVFVEKPLTNSGDTARGLCEIAEARGLVLMVGHVFLFNPAIRAAKEFLVGKELGKVHYISMKRTNLGPVRLDVNAAWDLATHDVAIANYWLASAPLSVSAVGAAWINPDIEDAVFLTLRYPDNVLVHVEASWLHPRKSRQISVVCENKMLTVDDIDQVEPIRVYDKAVVPDSQWTDTIAGFRSQIREGSVTIPRIQASEPLRSECQSFLDRCEGETDSLSDGWFGYGVVRVVEAANLSMKDGGREVELAGA
jgi:predicted dehydrogenase